MKFMFSFLIIPSIILNMPVGSISVNSINFVEYANLENGVAYIEELTWNRTDGGRTIIIGHNPGAFSNLQYMQVGDDIYLLMDGIEKTLHFVVYQVGLVDVEDTWLFNSPTSEYELVLMTCYWDYTQNKSRRLIVRAKLK